MSSTVKLIIAVVFAVELFYGLTSTSILQRVAFDIYECQHEDHGEIKLFFKELAVGQAFDFTRDGVTSAPKILEILENKVGFEDNEVSYTLDMSTNRLTRDDQSFVIFFVCELKEFRM
jgi:hypothetical protein